MPRNEFEVERLLEEGISIEVSAYDFDEFQLGRMVESAVEGNAVLSIRNSNKFDEFEIERIAENGKRNVVFR
jgi:predicted ester cyclase